MKKAHTHMDIEITIQENIMYAKINTYIPNTVQLKYFITYVNMRIIIKCINQNKKKDVITTEDV